MSKIVWDYNRLLQIEQNLIKPILEHISKALKSIYEGKSVKLLGSDFDKNIYFYVDKEFKTAKWSLSESKVGITDIEDVELDANSLHTAFENTIVEAIDLISANKLSEAENKFGEALQWKLKEKTSEKLNIFGKKPAIKESKQRVVDVAKVVYEKPKPKLSQLIESLQWLTNKFLGREVQPEKTAYEFSLAEGKVVEIKKPVQRATTLLKNIENAKDEALKLDIKPILENAQVFIADHEELFLLNSKTIKERVNEAAKTDIAITASKINEVVNTFIKMRNESADFKALVKQVLKEEGPNTDGANEEPKGDTELDGDGAVDSLNKQVEDDKMDFMKQFVQILTEIFQKIREIGQDDGELVKRVDNALNIIKKNQEQGKWDKEELAEIAREAIELAAKIEGIQPEETEVSKRSEEDEEDRESNKETISGVKGMKSEMYPASQQPAQEISGNYNYSGALRETDNKEEAKRTGPYAERTADIENFIWGKVQDIAKRAMSADYTPTQDDVKFYKIYEKWKNHEPMTEEEIGYLMNMSKMGVSGILNKALSKGKGIVNTNPDFKELALGRTSDLPSGIEEEVEEENEPTISPEGEITFQPDEFEQGTGDMEQWTCPQCERDFRAEAEISGLHCPYCGSKVADSELETEAGPAADQPGQEAGGFTDYKTEKSLKKEVAIGNIQQEVNEDKNKKEYEPGMCQDCGAPLNNAEGERCPGCQADDAPDDYVPPAKKEFAAPAYEEGEADEDIEDKMREQDPRKLILGKGEEEEQEAKISDEDFAGKPAIPPASKTPPFPPSDNFEQQPQFEAKDGCEHKIARYLDCADCEEKGKPCEEVVCTDCGESVNPKNYEMKDGLFYKKMEEAQSEPPMADEEAVETNEPPMADEQMYEYQYESKKCKGCGECEECMAEKKACDEEEFERVALDEAGLEGTLPAGTDVLATYRSKSDPTKRYYIIKPKTPGIPPYCTCPAWKFQSLPPSQRSCKHLEDYHSTQAAMVREESEEFIREAIEEGAGDSFPPGSDILATYRSKSNPDKRYYIIRGKDNNVYCTCPAWKFAGGMGSERSCKHLADYKAGGGSSIKEESPSPLEEAKKLKAKLKVIKESVKKIKNKKMKGK